jgi:hypothetical protein
VLPSTHIQCLGKSVVDLCLAAAGCLNDCGASKGQHCRHAVALGLELLDQAGLTLLPALLQVQQRRPFRTQGQGRLGALTVKSLPKRRCRVGTVYSQRVLAWVAVRLPAHTSQSNLRDLPGLARIRRCTAAVRQYRAMFDLVAPPGQAWQLNSLASCR